jgi:hypothetical protein
LAYCHRLWTSCCGCFSIGQIGLHLVHFHFFGILYHSWCMILFNVLMNFLTWSSQIALISTLGGLETLYFALGCLRWGPFALGCLRWGPFNLKTHSTATWRLVELNNSSKRRHGTFRRCVPSTRNSPEVLGSP